MLAKLDSTFPQGSLEGAAFASACGDIELAQWHVDKAIGFYNKALATYVELLGEESSAVATLFGALGMVNRTQGNYAKAVEMFEKSLAIQLKMGKELDIATTFNNLGAVYEAAGDYAKAVEFFEKDLAISRKVNHSPFGYSLALATHKLELDTQ